MPQKSINLFDQPFPDLLERIRNSKLAYGYDYRKHVIELGLGSQESVGYLRLPLHMSLQSDLFLQPDPSRVLYLSIESGNAAIIVMESKSAVYHTTFSAYMTRKKQGVSQIKYLNKKGKSRAGSRVRLASTIEFFENINTSLTKLLDEYQIDRIAMNCSPTLIPYLYNSKVTCPFDKKDDRLYKIPLHIQQSNYTQLEKAIKKLMAPTLFYDEQYENQLSELTLA
ncbi:MAG: hypothetical protein ABJF11_00405 [Reichenbachiella sp.]|uniref:hypothetical protein n=1 Tax=Reichenbachiella sp. TaxID=2184521 RepID=UPI003266E7F1